MGGPLHVSLAVVCWAAAVGCSSSPPLHPFPLFCLARCLLVGRQHTALLYCAVCRHQRYVYTKGISPPYPCNRFPMGQSPPRNPGIPRVSSVVTSVISAASPRKTIGIATTAARARGFVGPIVLKPGPHCLVAHNAKPSCVCQGWSQRRTGD